MYVVLSASLLSSQNHCVFGKTERDRETEVTQQTSGLSLNLVSLVLL